MKIRNNAKDCLKRKRKKKKIDSESDSDICPNIDPNIEPEIDPKPDSNIGEELPENNKSSENNRLPRRRVNNPCEKKLSEEIEQELKSREINENDIIRSNLTFEEKVDAIEYLKVLKNQKKYTEEWLCCRNLLYDKIKKNPNFREEDKKTIELLKKINENNVSLEQKIARCNHPIAVKAIIHRKYSEVQELTKKDENYYKVTEWINTVLDIPSKIIRFNEQHKDGLEFLINIKESMDKNIYGQNKVKERILEIASAIYTNPESNRRCVVLVGPPGVGKTSFARCLAEGMGLPFYQISFGGMKDSSFLKGQSITYIASRPGAIAEALIHMKAKNGILFLDELDKIQNTLEGREVASTLLHILDYSQNKEFKDMYMPEVPLDISNLFMIVAVNNINDIDSILLDRLPLIRLDKYSLKDKVEIGKNFIIPRILQHLKMFKEEVILTSEIMRYIIAKSKITEIGVRQLERNLYSIFEKINTLKIIHKSNNKKIKMSYDFSEFKIPLELSERIVDKLFEEFQDDESRSNYQHMFT